MAVATKLTQKREGHYLDCVTTSQRLQDPMMSPNPASSIAVNIILQEPSSTGIVSVLPKVHTATCPLDKIILDFISSQRALVAKSFSMNLVVSPAQPYLQAVLNPLAATDVHPISQGLAELLSTFWHVALPEKLAFMFVMFRTMRVRIIASLLNFVRPI